MRFVYIFAGVIIIAVSVLYWFVISRIDLFQYRAVRVGYSRFYQLMDGLFNEFRNEGDDDINEFTSFESLLRSDDDDEENEVDENLSCSSWKSLNDLIGVNHERVMNISKKIRKNPRILNDRLEKDLYITNTIVTSYNTRLSSAIENLPSFLLSYHNQLVDMLDTVNYINQGFQYFIGDAVQKIDHDQFEAHKSSCIRLAKILQLFETIIQSQNEAHLKCACTVATNLDGVVEHFFESVHLCVNNTGEEFSNYIKETITPMANSMETSIRAINRAMKRSKTSVEVFYQLPMKLTSSSSAIDLLHVQHRTQISGIIDQYVACQEKETRRTFLKTRALLIDLKECLRHDDNDEFSFKVF
ncbi:uncharacterized protein LOC116338306 [Contarinia nasturtii]|uniref:uncharacterized protein LOC116338306 n=1 Tax=Contarinia nasturtii TaxID=265458 RepID=UPI0012D3A5E8|nr:uncharacterized protein LOC116338306 [Contarinia nasturtii]